MALVGGILKGQALGCEFSRTHGRCLVWCIRLCAPSLLLLTRPLDFGNGGWNLSSRHTEARGEEVFFLSRLKPSVHVYVCICVYVCVRARESVCLYVHACVPVYACMCVSGHVNDVCRTPEIQVCPLDLTSVLKAPPPRYSYLAPSPYLAQGRAQDSSP